MVIEERMPEHLRPIWAIISQYEHRLTDGFGYYGDCEHRAEMCQKLYDLKMTAEPRRCPKCG